MEENEAEQEESIEKEVPVEVNWRSQVIALATLLPVLGLLWLGIEYLPKAGDWMGEKAEQIVGAGDRSEKSEESESLMEKTEAVTRPFEKAVPDPNSSPSASNHVVEFRRQIEEQLGGPERVEVRHLAVSDDESRMVSALKVFEGGGDGRLVEVFFERDEFGRYVSTEDSPLERPLKLWSE